MVSATPSAPEPSTVHILVTSTITVFPSQTAPPLNSSNMAQQWTWPQAAPANLHKEEVDTEDLNTHLQTPTVTAMPTHYTLPPSVSQGSNPNDRSNPRQTLSHEVIAACVIGLFAGIGFVGLAVTFFCRTCCATRDVIKSGKAKKSARCSDIEMGGGLTREDLRAHSMPYSKRNSGIQAVKKPQEAYFVEQPLHWPPEEMQRYQ
ncbi:hypothetical protein N0V83_009321 [Neocucurbitaria cava]|uniref:Uncharacterized protein n=1 Tax=Neocucurbitaria cava TaxID=798079 RepID=A0A9W9CI25_9PLEO|nr:hypothetical protein N0V83_009321 [Neocucurbitaria cava]